MASSPVDLVDGGDVVVMLEGRRSCYRLPYT